MMASNAVLGSAGLLGTVYAEVYSNNVGVIADALKGTLR